jgi:Mg2+-importing ATPase
MATRTEKEKPAFWQVPIAALQEQLNSSSDGLSSTEAAARLARFGPNQIHGEKKRTLILQFLAKFRNPLVIIKASRILG